MKSITTHVLDTALGKPGEGIETILEILEKEGPIHQEQWKEIAKGTTNDDGRIPGFVPEDFKVQPGVYRITFDTKAYFETQDRESFYPYASIVFEIKNPDTHYHVPLLISGYGFSTYRGS